LAPAIQTEEVVAALPSITPRQMHVRFTATISDRVTAVRKPTIHAGQQTWPWWSVQHCITIPTPALTGSDVVKMSWMRHPCEEEWAVKLQRSGVVVAGVHEMCHLEVRDSL